MATFYLDPVGGNDANDGTTFANRWQSITSGATAARIAPGDTIRIKKSPDPTSLGQTATWTNGSRTVTLTTAVTSEIKQATATWSATTNASSTTSTNRKFSSASSSLSVNATFTTGLSHYTTTTNTDYSAYQQITFWIMQTSGTLASGDGEISLKLCSDAAGATAVDTFNIPCIRALNTWQAFTIDKGSALGSSIQSVALYVNTDRGAQTFLINHISAVKAASAADSLSLTSLIGKNSGTEGWYAIDSINGTTVFLRTCGTIYNLSMSGAIPGYGGTTETVTTHKREPLILPPAFVGTSAFTFAWGSVQDSGTSGSPITFSGGWNDTDMSTQTGDTYLYGVNGFGYGFTALDKSHITVEKLNSFGFQIGVHVNGTTSNLNYTAKDVSCNDYGNLYLQNSSAALAGPVNCTFTIDNLNCAGQSSGYSIYLFRSVKNCKFTVVNLNSSWNAGFISYGDSALLNPYAISKIKANFTNVNGSYNGLYLNSLTESDITIGTMSGYVDTGIYTTFSAATNLAFNAVVRNKFKISTAFTGAASGHGIFGYGLVNNVFDFTGATVSGHGTMIATLRACDGNTIIGGTFSGNTSEVEIDSGTLTLINTTVTNYSLFESGAGCVKFQKYNSTANDHRQYYGYGTILTDATIRHTASGISWKISPTSTSYVTEDFPMVLPIGKIAVNASALVTAKVWVYRDNTALTAKLVCRGGQIAGVSADVVDTANGSASTWEELSITFTPSEAGVVELEVQAYGGTTHSVYVDDMTVTQA